MATSGTVTFNLDILDIIEEAYEIIGEGRGGYDLRTARRSLDLLTKEWGNRGINMWTLRQSLIPVTAGTQTVSLPADTVDMLDAQWRTGSGESQRDTPLTRFGRKRRANVANKNSTNFTPSQFYVHRTVPPVMRLWPVPTAGGTLVGWGLRTIEDTGKYTNTMDVPVRFQPALVYGLAYYLAIKTPAVAERVPLIQAEYDRQFSLAAEEDRDRSSFFMVPDLSSYNR